MQTLISLCLLLFLTIGCGSTSPFALESVTLTSEVSDPVVTTLVRPTLILSETRPLDPKNYWVA